MTVDEVLEILQTEGFSHTSQWKEQIELLHRCIGMQYMQADRVGSGNQIEYTEFHVRRAVARLRLFNVLGLVNTYKSTEVFREIQDVAMHHEDGIAIHDGSDVHWVRGDIEEVVTSLMHDGLGFVAIPCWIESLNSNFATVELQTEEE